MKEQGNSGTQGGAPGSLIKNIEFLGHAAFKIKGSALIYTDPYQIQKDETADIILITHSHFDHCSPEDVKKICGSETAIIASADCAGALKGLGGRFIGLTPYQTTQVKGVTVEAVPAYNIDKSFHPRSSNWNGYVFEMDSVRYYHPGDTDKIPEMDNVKADVVFMPVGGTYTMDNKEAASAVAVINPRAAIPMHYGAVVGSKKDAQEFVKLVGKKGALILPHTR